MQSVRLHTPKSQVYFYEYFVNSHKLTPPSCWISRAWGLAQNLSWTGWSGLTYDWSWFWQKLTQTNTNRQDTWLNIHPRDGTLCVAMTSLRNTNPTIYTRLVNRIQARQFKNKCAAIRLGRHLKSCPIYIINWCPYSKFQHIFNFSHPGSDYDSTHYNFPSAPLLTYLKHLHIQIQTHPCANGQQDFHEIFLGIWSSGK